MTKKERYEKALAWWEATNPNADTELKFRNNFELLVAVMLSAQCTDARVNMVTPTLFAAYPDPETMSKAPEEEILGYIMSISYPNAKAKYLSQTSKILVEKYGGEVPSGFDDLTSLPGVGRKTANVMSICAFGRPAMPVDTHVFRVANRIGLTATKTPEATEKELLKNIPKDKLHHAHHWLVLHGRYICTALRPKCYNCGLTEICKFYNKENEAKEQKGLFD